MHFASHTNTSPERLLDRRDFLFVATMVGGFAGFNFALDRASRSHRELSPEVRARLNEISNSNPLWVKVESMGRVAEKWTASVEDKATIEIVSFNKYSRGPQYTWYQVTLISPQEVVHYRCRQGSARKEDLEAILPLFRQAKSAPKERPLVVD